ncbi:oligosaccharide flippase family protein [Budvicia aquatica]|nr:oligosaccharide flippase family protein [Budvicia aquatica]VFS52826.1 Putative O-antigen transporter [Budvicia aquatica]
MKWITLCSISARFMLVPLTFVFVQGIDDLWIAALIQGGTNFIAGLIGFYFIFNNNWVGGPIFSLERIRCSLRDGWHVFVSTSAISLYTTSTTVILGFLAGPVSVGYFNAANMIRGAVQSLLNPISQAIYPRISFLMDNNYSKAILLIRKSLMYLGVISLCASVFLILFSSLIVKYGVGDEYQASVSVLRWMAFLPFFISLSNVFGIQTMLTHNYKKQFSWILVVCGLSNLIIIFPLVYYFQQDGAAMSMLLTELCVTIIMYLFLRSKNIYLIRGK